jgi:hypothetical protein
MIVALPGLASPIVAIGLKTDDKLAWKDESLVDQA